MFQYLEAVVGDKSLSFPPDLLRPLYELYLDISSLYLQGGDEKQGGQPPLVEVLLDSSLTSDLRMGLNAVEFQDRKEIEQRFDDIEGTIKKIQSTRAGPRAPLGMSSN